MSDLQTIRARIADELDRTDLNEQINKAVNSAIKHYERDDWWFMEEDKEISCSAGQNAYALPAAPLEFSEDLFITCEVSSREYTLSPITHTHYVELHRSQPTGIPDKYSKFDGQLFVTPAPTQSDYILHLYYYAKNIELSSDAASNNWITAAESLIRARAKWDIYANIVKDREEATIQKQIEMDELRSLIAENNNRQSSGLIRPRRM